MRLPTMRRRRGSVGHLWDYLSIAMRSDGFVIVFEQTDSGTLQIGDTVSMLGGKLYPTLKASHCGAD